MYIWLVISINYCFIFCEVLSAVTYRHNEVQPGSVETFTTGFSTTSAVIQASYENLTRFETTSDQTIFQSISQTTNDRSHDNTTNQITNTRFQKVTSVKEVTNTHSTSQTNGPSTRGSFDTIVSISSDSLSKSTTSRVSADAGSNYITTTVSTVAKSRDITNITNLSTDNTNSLSPNMESHDTTITADLGLNDITTPTGDEHPQLMNHDISTQHIYETYNNTDNIDEIKPSSGRFRRPPKIILNLRSKLGIGGLYIILLVLLYTATVSFFVMLRE